MDQIEGLRKSLSDKGEERIEIWYSPKPGSSGDEVIPNLRPKPGKKMEFTMNQIAQTGKSRRWGIFLHLLVKNSNAGTVLEFGSCAGISGCYLASPDCVDTFITVEGSPPLARIAEENIHTVAPRGIVVNSSFDEAIDQELPKLPTKIDAVFIDGHHEKIATIHYYERVNPYLNNKAIVVFDDISWSHDMREAWNILSSRPEFTHVIDLGQIGICMYDRYQTERRKEPMYWDLQTVFGRVKIGDPHGWKQ